MRDAEKSSFFNGRFLARHSSNKFGFARSLSKRFDSEEVGTGFFYFNCLIKTNKMMKKLFFLAFAAFAVVACSDENYYELETTKVVGFESAVLDESGFIWGKPYAVLLDEDAEDACCNLDVITNFGSGSLYFYDAIYFESDARFLSLFTDYMGTYDTWNGFVVSNRTDRETAGFTNDKSVYAEGGADGSKQFAVAYYGAWTPKPWGVPTVEFATAVAPQSVAVANTTYLYLYFKGTPAAAPADVKAVFTGYNGKVKTGEMKVVLAAADGTVKEGWETVDLTALGTVTSIACTVETEDKNCPYYFAIDNLTYTK